MNQSLHSQKVERLASQLREEKGEGYASLQKSEVSHMLPLANDARRHDQKINIRDFKEIIEIDPTQKIAKVEPGVTFSDLVQATLKHGLIPYLVPELKTITIGGAISGGSVESMSYRYGGFHDNCLEYEIVTGNGVVLRCSPQENSEIFQMMHYSYGTLGILTQITFKLMEAKPYVRMRYEKHTTYDAYMQALTEHCRKGTADFIDAIIHGPDRYSICLGTMTDEAPYTSSYDYLKVFYKSTWKRDEDYLKIYDYFFRYDADCHWLSRKIPGLETLPGRLLFGKAFLSSTRLLKLSNKLTPFIQGKGRPDVVLDCFIPSSRFGNFYEFYQKRFNYYPLWIVPYRITQPYAFLADDYAQGIADDLFIDCAIYGKPNNEPDVDYYQLLEEKLFELNGIKALIASNSYTEDRFWSIYNRDRYQRVKGITDPTGRFRNLYEKVHCRK